MVFFASLMLVASVGFAQTEDLDCEDFATPQQAQDYFDSQGPGDSDRLDADGDGRACEGDEDSTDSTDSADSADSLSGTIEPEDNDAVSGDQYEDQQQPAPNTPNTGGPALLPLAGALMLFPFGGYFLTRR